MTESNRGLSVSDQNILILPKSSPKLRRILLLTIGSLKGQRKTQE